MTTSPDVYGLRTVRISTGNTANLERKAQLYREGHDPHSTCQSGGNVFPEESREPGGHAT